MDVTAQSRTDTEPLSATTSWEMWVDRLFTWIPYVLLGAAIVFAQFETRPVSDRLQSYALAAAAALWTWMTFTRAGRPTQVSQPLLQLYLVGFLILAAALVSNQHIFLIYACAGFFHAALLRPWPLVFLGIGFFACVVHAHIILGERTREHWAIYLGVVAIQTITTGIGLFAGEKISEIADERRVALSRLETAMEENAGLHAQLVVQAKEAGALEERERLAGEIHDTIAQDLAGIVTQLEAVHQSWEDDEELRRRVGAASQLARDGLADARRAVRALEPAQLEGARLPSALEDLVVRWTELSGVDADVTLTGARRRLDPEIESTLFRAAQEALSNVERHAAATRVRLTLSFANDSVMLDVRDDGEGFEVGTPPGPDCYGLAAMKRRVVHLDGTMHVESTPGDGTAISIRIPNDRPGGNP